MQLSDDAYQKKLAAIKRQQERARERAKDPEVIARKREKQRLALMRQREKERARQADPTYRKAKVEKASRIKASAKPIRSKGLKGRSPSAEEKQIMNAIGQLPCICCMLHGRHSPIISLHHLDGRTKPWAHAKVLPLCAYHHDTPVNSEFEDLIPYHAKGKEGGRKAWELVNDDQWRLLIKCYELAGISLPFEVNVNGE
ncbi:Ref family recombination enhancement nuclease [Photobacterium leiognathi]|uniref:Ref family recombination enhancement nuclease n=1 Tax=Photobacterium leiognathi TaxID=553611 RepID=UPI002980AD71|nr:Ref family recombination enhancement nuclease [Photobacterium leiognathi]